MRERLFTAIELPGEVVDALVAHQPPAGQGIRPVGRAQMHLTLHFIGQADPEAVKAALADARAPPFELTIGALGMFARRGRPAALWAGVEPSAPLQALHDAIGAALAEAGFAVESRAYRPHVTLARCKPHADREQLRTFLRGAAIDPLTFPVTRFTLIASLPADDGPNYEPRAHFPLE